jgi:hypothetical protein
MHECEPFFGVAKPDLMSTHVKSVLRQDTCHSLAPHNLAELNRLDVEKMENSNAPLLVRRSVYFILAGGLLYFVSWSPILCRVTRGIVKYPEQMPTPVWIATIGIFVFYQLFIIAQCSSMLSRVREIFQAQIGTIETPVRRSALSTFVKHKWTTGYRDCIYVYFLLCTSVPGWQSLAALAGGVSIDLIAAVLYSIPSVRLLFGMSSNQQLAEPWATTCFLLFIWTSVIYLSGRVEYARSHADARSEARTTSQVPFYQFMMLYVTISITAFFVWGYSVMGNLEGVSATPWVIAASCLFATILFLMIKLGAARIEYIAQPAAVDSSGDEQCEIKAMSQLYDAHWYAMVFHICLVLFTLFIGHVNQGIDWYTEYLGMSKPAYFFTTDWESLESKRIIHNGDESKIGLSHCATSNALPLLLIPICCAWSVCSAVQHYVSASTLHGSGGVSKVDECTVMIILAFAFATPGVYLHGVTFGTICLWFVMLGPACLIVSIVYGGVWDLFEQDVHTPSVSVSPPYWKRVKQLETVSTYRWIEYTISASLMHIVVCYTAGINSSHELVLCVCCFGFSMITTHLANSTLSRAENAEYTKSVHMNSTSSGADMEKSTHLHLCVCSRKSSEITIRNRVDNELPFIFLSFCAKGVLCIALTFPLVFIDRRDFELQPSVCYGQ